MLLLLSGCPLSTMVRRVINRLPLPSPVAQFWHLSVDSWGAARGLNVVFVVLLFVDNRVVHHVSAATT